MSLKQRVEWKQWQERHSMENKPLLIGLQFICRDVSKREDGRLHDVSEAPTLMHRS